MIRRLAPTGPGWRALDLGWPRAAERGLSGQVTFHSEDAGAWRRPADLVVNVGAGYIWAIPARRWLLHRLTSPGGKVLFADGFYRSAPGGRIREMFGDLPDLTSLAQSAVDAGFRPLHVAE